MKKRMSEDDPRQDEKYGRGRPEEEERDEDEEPVEAACGGYMGEMGQGLMGPDMMMPTMYNGVDPESGNPVPVGADEENVRDDIPAMISEGEYVLPADVVKWHGLKGVMDIQNEAKSGLMSMAMEGLIQQVDVSGESDDHPHEHVEYDNNTAAFIYTTPHSATQEQIDEIYNSVKKETKKDVFIQVDGNKIVFGGTDQLVEHIVLDIAESYTKKIVGKNPEGKKSTLKAYSNENHSVQPCFVLSEKFGQKQIDEIIRLYELVTGISGIGWFGDNRFYIDTKSETIDHGSLDVAELLVRRTIEPMGITIDTHGFKSLPRQESQEDELDEEEMMYEDKYEQLVNHTEEAGMEVIEEDGEIMVEEQKAYPKNTASISNTPKIVFMR